MRQVAVQGWNEDLDQCESEIDEQVLGKWKSIKLMKIGKGLVGDSQKEQYRVSLQVLIILFV